MRRVPDVRVLGEIRRVEPGADRVGDGWAGHGVGSSPQKACRHRLGECGGEFVGTPGALAHVGQDGPTRSSSWVAVRQSRPVFPGNAVIERVLGAEDGSPGPVEGCLVEAFPDRGTQHRNGASRWISRGRYSSGYRLALR